METSVEERTAAREVTVQQVEEDDLDLLALFDDEPEPFDFEQSATGSSEQGTPKQEKTLSVEARIKYWKDFFRHLCYDPVWKLDDLSEPSAYRFAAHIKESEFLLQINTGMHRKYAELNSPYFYVKIYDLRKRVEIKQLEYTESLAVFFDDKKEMKRFIKFIDSLPLQFASRPKCPHCGVELDLINPQKLSQKPFWAHSFRERDRLKGIKAEVDPAKETAKEKCVYVQSLLGLTPNIPETRS